MKVRHGDLVMHSYAEINTTTNEASSYRKADLS
jgi:hypothetical protein